MWSMALLCHDFVYADAILSRKWSFQEVRNLLASQVAVLSGELSCVSCGCHGTAHVIHCLSPGGRDRQGGAIIVMVLQGERECNPPDIGKIMTYLSNIPE